MARRKGRSFSYLCICSYPEKANIWQRLGTKTNKTDSHKDTVSITKECRSVKLRTRCDSRRLAKKVGLPFLPSVPNLNGKHFRARALHHRDCAASAWNAALIVAGFQEHALLFLNWMGQLFCLICMK